MQRSAQPTQVTPRNTTLTVQVTRDWGGIRVAIDASKLRALHIATDTGGKRKQLPHPMLAGYVFCTELGEVPWHACGHGNFPHSIKVLVPRAGNEPAAYRRLRVTATTFKGGRRTLVGYRGRGRSPA